MSMKANTAARAWPRSRPQPVRRTVRQAAAGGPGRSRTRPHPASPGGLPRRRTARGPRQGGGARSHQRRSRRPRGCRRVAWDEAAARVADAFCAAQIREGTAGHYLRTAFLPTPGRRSAGIFGMEAENAASWRTTSPEVQHVHTGARARRTAGHDGREPPPSDGHRRTILDPDATHVGVGLGRGARQFPHGPGVPDAAAGRADPRTSAPMSRTRSSSRDGPWRRTASPS